MTKKREIPDKLRGPSVKKRYERKENGKNATGAPTKYDHSFCEKLIQFFQREPFELYETDKGPTRLANRLPTFDRFAFENNITHETLLEWCKVYPEFSLAYNAAKQMQREFLVTNGLAGLYPPASFIFVAKNITDMRDKQEVEHSGNVNHEGFKIIIEDATSKDAPEAS